MKNLYQILAVQPGATPDEIKRAYYLLAKRVHPDSGEAADVKKFYEITEAYQILSDATRRRAYDATLKTGRLEKGWMGSDETVEVVYGRPSHEQTLEYRMHELSRYRRQVFWQAVGKVILISVAGGGVGYALALILNGFALLGVVAGVAFALVWAVGSHFDLESFMVNPTRFKVVLWGGRLLQFFAALYFAGLFFYHLLR